MRGGCVPLLGETPTFVFSFWLGHLFFYPLTHWKVRILTTHCPQEKTGPDLKQLAQSSVTPLLLLAVG